MLLKAKEPFRFYTRLHLSELTGLRATNLSQLLNLIKKVPGSCIYHHTHRFLQQHQYLSPEPPNDFAYWVTDVLGEDELGEKLSSIDTIQYATIRSLREKIVSTIEDYLKENGMARLRFAWEGEEFHFIKSVSFVLPTEYLVGDLGELLEVIKKITIDSIYFHIFESRLRLEKMDNDFSNWIRNSIGDKELADEISGLDPYTYTLDGLRNKLIRMLEKRIES
ncbi:MAG: DUF5752 family protein [Candidatus Omnitrophica bacterium]|jgi:hypothetical protein|nr:DUF5752 family protein [Candidatus Omnitrophota bacterium]MDD3274356.1 DUF5752 family protein [Candidatus Omnitrophota bacterium]MDD5078124.1 DUF5752 family protein [Candidatus Omnitrophota bacterium]MDD5724547.1 DUF5752 family protein [Candidatus Omnitrophota bacterium]